MTHRLLSWTLVAAAVAFSAAYGVVADVNAQAPSKPAPHLADGRPDLNGTWDHGGGISFIRTQTLPGGSVCILDCPQPAGAGARGGNNQGPGGGRGFPKYK